MILKQIEVNLGERSYPIYVGRGMLSDLSTTLQAREINGRIVLMTDSNVAPIYLMPLRKQLRQAGHDVVSLILPPGEGQKSLARAGKIFTEMLKAGVDRKSVIVALGGGVIGDLAGFVAATFQRGISIVQMPTTLLAQVDSSVGGKVAVNHPLGKNMIGAFHQPSFVWADSEYLATLPYREIVCGVGEIVKYGLAWDKELFSFLESHLDKVLTLDRESTSHVQLRCLEIKSDIVSKDERDTGLRALLNLGHTVGHALEAAGNYGFLKHGEAVLFGIKAESFIAKELGMISEDVYLRIVELVNRIPIKVGVRRLKSADILRMIRRDKKSVDRGTRFVLPTRIGEATIVDHVDEKLVAESVKQLWKANT